MFSNWAENHIRNKGVNNILGSIAQIILGREDTTRYTSLTDMGYKIEHTRFTSRSYKIF